MSQVHMISDLLSAVPMPMLIVGHDERVSAMNDPARAILGDGEGRLYLTVIRQPEPVSLLERVLGGGEGGEVTWRVSSRGRDSVYRGKVAAVAGLGASLAFEDTSDLEHAVDMRRDFVANVSHELRTPLTALMGFIETLQGAARDDAGARTRFLEIMSREALRMNRLVADLLSLGHVEAEERVRPSGLIDPLALVQAAVTTMSGQAAAMGVELALSVDADLPRVRGDMDQLTQVMNNLLENGIKYGGGGGIVTVRLGVVDHDPVLRGPALSIAVIDRGEGMDPIHIPRLTERFYRVDGHRSRERGGTGLGLAIVKHILNRHRGRLRIESARGQGSTFEVLIPLE